MQFLVVVLFLSGVLQVSHACSCAYYPGSSIPYWQSQICIALKNRDRGGFRKFFSFIFESRCGENRSSGFRPGSTQTGLYCHRRGLKFSIQEVDELY